MEGTAIHVTTLVSLEPRFARYSIAAKSAARIALAISNHPAPANALAGISNPIAASRKQIRTTKPVGRVK